MSSLKKGEKILETLKRINEEIEVDNSVAEKLKKIEEARKMPINLFPFKETREALLEELEKVKEKLISIFT